MVKVAGWFDEDHDRGYLGPPHILGTVPLGGFHLQRIYCLVWSGTGVWDVKEHMMHSGGERVGE